METKEIEHLVRLLSFPYPLYTAFQVNKSLAQVDCIMGEKVV